MSERGITKASAHPVEITDEEIRAAVEASLHRLRAMAGLPPVSLRERSIEEGER